MNELKIRFDKEGCKYYVYFNDAWGNCVYQSDPFDTLEDAKAFKEVQDDSADHSEQEKDAE
jgi:hypothetical protein